MDKKTFKIASGKHEGKEFTIDDIVFEGEEDLIEKESLDKITNFLDEVDKERLHILKMITIILKLPKAGYGPAKQLRNLIDIKTRLKKWIDFFQVDIPDIANITFIHSKKLNDTHNLIVPADCEINDSTLREREQTVKWYNNQLQKYLTYQLKSLQTDIDNYISQIKNFQDNPNIEDWYPELADKDDPRIKYHSYNYWNTAIDLYHSDTYGSREAVYNHIDENMKRLGLEHRKKLSTFKTRLSKEISKRMNDHE